MASSMTIPEVKRLIKKKIFQATGASIRLTEMKIFNILERPDNSIAAVWFTVYHVKCGIISYLIDWDKCMIYITVERQRDYHGEIKFDGRY